MVFIVVLQTGVDDRSVLEYRDALIGRLDTTFRALEFAATNDTANFQTLLRQAVSEPGVGVYLDGPDVQLPSSKVLAISMIFHELMTNALKYVHSLTPTS
ncbi:hypothetical protein [Pararhizobium sp. PWRC1-1]|uniref:hypothetical protein n=1 Tax=Pararhizobium sp. PWRC1-1 TaxID=2804566 RepID=UPI003CEDDD66